MSDYTGSDKWKMKARFTTGSSNITEGLVSKGIVSYKEGIQTGSYLPHDIKMFNMFPSWMRTDEWGEDVIDVEKGNSGVFGLDYFHTSESGWITGLGFHENYEESDFSISVGKEKGNSYAGIEFTEGSGLSFKIRAGF